METNDLLIFLLIYFYLPLWGIAGFADWCCHRATKIETTSGLLETIMHSIMGIQIAIPIILCLMFKVNVLILLICIAALILHEVVAHLDVHYASPRREISIWEMHAHNYLATLPLFMISMIFVLNWDIAIKLITFDWHGELEFIRIKSHYVDHTYLFFYFMFMSIICVFPYFEEFIRCLRIRLSK